jgi:PAS domain S-box-containing protein
MMVRPELNQELLGNVFESMGGAVVTTDLAGNISFFNQTAEVLTSYSQAEALHKPLPEIVHLQNPNPAEGTSHLLSQVLVTGQAMELTRDTSLVGGDENRHYIIGSLAPIKDAAGNLQGTILVFHNISHLKQTQEALEKANTELTSRLQSQDNVLQKAEAALISSMQKEHEQLELKSRFISTISHEFRSPLTTITITSDLLLSFGDQLTPEESVLYMEKIQSDVGVMTKMLDELVMLEKIETGKYPLNITGFDLAHLTRTVLSEYQASLSSNHRLYLECLEGPFTLQADSRLIRQAISHLVSNAIKFSPDGGKIGVILKRRHNSLQLSITDPGIGVLAKDMDHLYDVFYRGQNVGSIPGTGLGLALVKKFLSLHKGSIVLKSCIGGGTTFNMTIPVAAG